MSYDDFVVQDSHGEPHTGWTSPLDRRQWDACSVPGGVAPNVPFDTPHRSRGRCLARAHGTRRPPSTPIPEAVPVVQSELQPTATLGGRCRISATASGTEKEASVRTARGVVWAIMATLLAVSVVGAGAGIWTGDWRYAALGGLAFLVVAILGSQFDVPASGTGSGDSGRDRPSDPGNDGGRR